MAELLVIPNTFILVMAIVTGGVLAFLAKKAIKRMHIPFLEIYFKKGTIAWVMMKDKELIPFTVKPRNGYFTIYNNRIKGIFKIDSRFVFFMGPTPCYLYDGGNMNPIDPVVVNELNKFAESNKLSIITQKDMRHSRMLRTLKNRLTLGKAKEQIMEYGQNQQALLDQTIVEGNEEINNRMKEWNEKHNASIKLEGKQQGVYLVEYLRQQNRLPEKEADSFVWKLENEKIDFPNLIEELHENEIISINEPLDMGVEKFLYDFGAQDPLNLSGHVDDLRVGRKGLGGMTATPVKSFIPASVIFALLIGGAIAFIAITNSGVIDEIAGGSIKLPGFGYLFKLFLNI